MLHVLSTKSSGIHKRLLQRKTLPLIFVQASTSPFLSLNEIGYLMSVLLLFRISCSSVTLSLPSAALPRTSLCTRFQQNRWKKSSVTLCRSLTTENSSVHQRLRFFENVCTSEKSHEVGLFLLAAESYVLVFSLVFSPHKHIEAQNCAWKPISSEVPAGEAIDLPSYSEIREFKVTALPQFYYHIFGPE